jgi:hypothetical protein
VILVAIDIGQFGDEGLEVGACFLEDGCRRLGAAGCDQRWAVGCGLLLAAESGEEGLPALGLPVKGGQELVPAVGVKVSLLGMAHVRLLGSIVPADPRSELKAHLSPHLGRWTVV